MKTNTKRVVGGEMIAERTLADVPKLYAEIAELRALNAEMLLALKQDAQLMVFIESSLNSVAIPSGLPDVSRCFCDIRQALLHTVAARKAAIAKAETTKTT